MAHPIEKEIAELLTRLPIEQRQQVLDFARELVEPGPRGVPGKNLIAFGGRIPMNDLLQIQQAIEEGCEAVNLNEW